jgi:hypothetical protein
MTISYSEINAALDVVAITGTLDTYEGDTALWDDDIQPSDFTGKGINFYMSGSYDPTIDYDEYNFTVNCRAPTKADSITIANAVITELDRRNYSGYYTTCTALPTLPPASETDNYNTIITVNLTKH